MTDGCASLTIVRAAQETALRRSGLRWLSAAGPDEALDRFRREWPDLLLVPLLVLWWLLGRRVRRPGWAPSAERSRALGATGRAATCGACALLVINNNGFTTTNCVNSRLQ